MIHQRLAETGGEHPLGQRHADRHPDPLAERAGGGLDAWMVAVFGVARGDGMQRAENLDVFDPHALLADQVEQGVEQHAAVPGGEHEAVAVGPARVGGVELQEPRP